MAGKKTKVRVARAGKTLDGREIPDKHIREMAEHYNPQVYEAGINVDHMRSIFPDSVFGKYGNVSALEVEEEKGQVYLVAEVEPFDNLVALSKKGQKQHFSIEYFPDAAGLGHAYMTGLAVTDDPASLGTGKLSFSGKGALYSEALACETFTFEDDQAAPQSSDEAEKSPFLQAFRNKLFARKEAEVPTVADDSADVKEALGDLAQEFSKLQEKLGAIDALERQVSEMSKVFKTLETTPHEYTPRPTSDGMGEFENTDC